MFINLNKKQDNEIKKSSNYVNFLIDGMILFLKFIFGTWYKGDLYLLMLCKQLVHTFLQSKFF
jgi:hypothetical protein